MAETANFNTMKVPDFGGMFPDKSGMRKVRVLSAALAAQVRGDWINAALGRNGIDHAANCVILPETAIGAAIMGTAPHGLLESPEFQKMLYDPGDLDSRGFLNMAERKLEKSLGDLNDENGRPLTLDSLLDPQIRLRADVQDVLQPYHIMLLNFIDTLKVMLLDKSAINGNPQLKGLTSLVPGRRNSHNKSIWQVIYGRMRWRIKIALIVNIIIWAFIIFGELMARIKGG